VAAGPEESLLLGADFIGIGWLCITTFLKDGEFLQKRTTGAGGRNLKGDPSSLTGSGPSCCCKETEQGYKASLETIARICKQVVPVLQKYQLQRQVVSATVLGLS
jgi:hypothetical protein